MQPPVRRDRIKKDWQAVCVRRPGKKAAMQHLRYGHSRLRFARRLAFCSG
ncbi:hypothetical protein ACFSHQ_12915 [Gemmobacter lanyuensis]